MKIILEIDTDAPLTSKSKEILSILAGGDYRSETATIDKMSHTVTTITPHVKIDPADNPESGSMTTIAEIKNIGFGEPDSPSDLNIDPANMGFGGELPPVPGMQPVILGNPNTPLPDTVYPNAAPPAGQLDKTGCPWDARIHSTPAKQNADLTWKSRRGVDKVEAAVIAEELRRIASLNNHTHLGSTQLNTTAPPGQTFAPVNMPAPPGQMPAPPQHSGMSDDPTQPIYTRMMTYITPLMVAGRLTLQNLEFFSRQVGAVDGQGVGHVVLLQHAPALIPRFIEIVNAHLAATPHG